MTTRQTSLNWIVHLLQTIAKKSNVNITDSHWEEDTTYGVTQYNLVVVGSDQKRVIKLFAVEEIDRCLSDNMLQTDIHTRLTRLVNFLGGRVETPSGYSRKMRERRHS